LTFGEGCDKNLTLTQREGECVKTAVIILGHGSRSSGAERAIAQVAAELRKNCGFEIVEHAFLQYVPPAFNEILEGCIFRQARKVIIIPFFMQSGAHVAKDIPELVENARKRHPSIEFIVTDHVGKHPLMVAIVKSLAEQSK
jgi:sirohydrochlorin ferrochelatase